MRTSQPVSYRAADHYGYVTVFGRELVGTLAMRYVLIGFLLPDMLLTVFAAIALRRPIMVSMALPFPAMRRAIGAHKGPQHDNAADPGVPQIDHHEQLLPSAS
jgi:hypothetical protein